MIIESLDARYMHLRNAEVRVRRYSNGTTALIAEDKDDEGYPNIEYLTVNLLSYGLTPPDNEHVYVPSYAENEGVPEALATAGIIKLVEPVTFGYGRGWLAQITAPELLRELEEEV